MVKLAQRGFTLIELVVVIVILGVLAAFAVPRFMGLETEARVASVKSLAGSLRSAASMAHGMCVARGCSNANQTLVIGGQNVTFVNQYPTLATIDDTLETPEGFTFTPGNGRFTKTGARTNNCYVEYVQAANGASPQLRYRAGIVGQVTETAVNDALRIDC